MYMIPFDKIREKTFWEMSSFVKFYLFVKNDTSRKVFHAFCFRDLSLNLFSFLEFIDPKLLFFAFIA